MKKESIIKKIIQVEMLLQRLENKDTLAVNPHRGQGRILLLLKDHPNISQKDLSKLLEMRNQSFCELLTKLEKQEHIRRTLSISDHRTMNIQLTKSGKCIANAIACKRKIFEDVFLCFDDQEKEQFYYLLDKLLHSLEQKVEDISI